LLRTRKKKNCIFLTEEKLVLPLDTWSSSSEGGEKRGKGKKVGDKKKPRAPPSLHGEKSLLLEVEGGKKSFDLPDHVGPNIIPKKGKKKGFTWRKEKGKKGIVRNGAFDLKN